MAPPDVSPEGRKAMENRPRPRLRRRDNAGVPGFDPCPDPRGPRPPRGSRLAVRKEPHRRSCSRPSLGRIPRMSAHRPHPPSPIRSHRRDSIHYQTRNRRFAAPGWAGRDSTAGHTPCRSMVPRRSALRTSPSTSLRVTIPPQSIGDTGKAGEDRPRQRGQENENQQEFQKREARAGGRNSQGPSPVTAARSS